MAYLDAQHSLKLTFFSTLTGASLAFLGIGLTVQLSFPSQALWFSPAYGAGAAAAVLGVQKLNEANDIMVSMKR